MSSGAAVSSMGPDSPYALKSVTEIVSVLRNLERHNQFLQLSVPQTGTSLMVRLQQVGLHELVLDDPGADFGHKIEAADHVTLEAFLDGVLIFFPLSRIQLQVNAGQSRLLAPLPSYLLHMQRRESFRVHLPVSNPLVCRAKVQEKTLMLPIDDLGTGGLGLFDDDLILPSEPGFVLRGCSVDLPQRSSIMFDLRVVQVRSMPLRSGKLRQRLGCAFEGPQSSRTVQELQRYVSQLERENLARRRGWTRSVAQ
jgi:c-di-GMP-binding flagellar brake protein YcgR